MCGKLKQYYFDLVHFDLVVLFPPHRNNRTAQCTSKENISKVYYLNRNFNMSNAQDYVWTRYS